MSEPYPRHDKLPYEPSDDVSVYGIVKFGVFLTAVVTLCVVLCIWMFGWLYTRHSTGPAYATSTPAPRELPPAPRLQLDQPGDLKKHRQEEDLVLQSYAVLDPKEKRVRIPVDRAMKLIAERGLPARKQE